MDLASLGTPPQGEGARAERRSVGRDSDATSETARFASTPLHETNRRDEEEEAFRVARGDVAPMRRGDEKPRKDFGEKSHARASSVVVNDCDYERLRTDDATTELGCRLEVTDDEGEGSQKNMSWNERERVSFPHANRALPESAVSQIKAAYKRGLAAPVAPPPRRLGRPVDLMSDSTSIEKSSDDITFDRVQSNANARLSHVTSRRVGLVGDDETSSRLVEESDDAGTGTISLFPKPPRGGSETPASFAPGRSRPSAIHSLGDAVVNALARRRLDEARLTNAERMEARMRGRVRVAGAAGAGDGDGDRE